MHNDRDKPLVKLGCCHFIIQYFIVLLLTVNNNCFAQQHLTTIQLKHTRAELLIPAIKAQISANSSVSTYNNKLILNVTDKELADIHQLIDQLDAAGKQLLIHIKKVNNNLNSQQQGEISLQHHGKATIHLGNGIQTTNQPASNHNTTTITLKQQTTHRAGYSGHGIRATEGIPAYIGTGETIIINNRQTMTNGKTLSTRKPLNANNGFYATAWVTEDQVTISITQKAQQFVNATKRSNQQLQTQVSGKLNEWIYVGDINKSSLSSKDRINSLETGTTISSDQFYLKVETLN